MNLFSIFDPSSSLLFPNWLNLIFIVVIIGPTFWMGSSKKLLMKMFTLKTLSMEMKTLLNLNNMGKSMFFIVLVMMIMLNNFLGLYPYIFTYSSHMVFTLSLALPAWLASLVYGWKSKTDKMLAHLIPNSTSFVLMPFMVLIETISIIIRPMTLAIRLATNMIAGHLLLVLLSDQNYFTFSLIMKSMVIGVQMLLLSLELGVAIVQSYVFSTLSLLYASESN